MTLLLGEASDVRVGQPVQTLEGSEPIFVQLELRHAEPGVRLLVLTAEPLLAQELADCIRPKVRHLVADGRPASMHRRPVRRYLRHMRCVVELGSLLT